MNFKSTEGKTMLNITAPDLLGSLSARPVDRRGYYRSPITLPDYRLGRPPANKGLTYPAETLTRDEIHRLMAGFGKGNAGVRNRAAVVLMWRSGLRVAEALALMPKDVDLERGTVTVLHGKGDRRRMVGIDPGAAAVVQLWIDRRRTLGLTSRQPLLCVFSQGSQGQPLNSAYVREALKDAAARAGLDKRVHPHGLRHTFASELAREGVPVHVIQKLLGHADLATTARYVDHLAPWEAIDAVRAREWQHVTHPSSPPQALPLDERDQIPGQLELAAF